mmetsp:Transcript_21882/g.51860  ORF Transcript_21882/g.51860 Transcript_21882/m.51860 type:complete len:228 (-) Transcript_21882:34-717(-)
MNTASRTRLQPHTSHTPDCQLPNRQRPCEKRMLVLYCPSGPRLSLSWTSHADVLGRGQELAVLWVANDENECCGDAGEEHYGERLARQRCPGGNLSFVHGSDSGEADLLLLPRQLQFLGRVSLSRSDWCRRRLELEQPSSSLLEASLLVLPRLLQLLGRSKREEVIDLHILRLLGHACTRVAGRKRVASGRESGRPGGWQAQRRDRRAQHQRECWDEISQHRDDMLL